MSRMRAADRICLACRVITLSQYNPDPLCSACERASHDTAGIVPTWLWASDPMREALARVVLRGVDTVDVDRREFTTLAGGLTAAAVLPVPARADRAHVRYLQSALTRLRTQDHMVGGGALLV